MPTVQVERLPVQSLGLGLLGFDHLQIVLRSDFEGTGECQDSWFVIEGLREPDGAGLRLAVEGWHGGTTLSDANGGLTGAALVARIGTADGRGARVITAGREAMALWADLVSYATDIERQHFPYIALTLPSSPLPTINSSSLVASLLHHAGIGMDRALPRGARLLPGTATLLGTSRDDRLEAGGGFSTLVAGEGRDDLRGSANARQIDKLFGGRGDDVFHWSAGFNIVHGGQPGLGYADDGRDTIDYSGAGEIRIDAPEAPVAHLVPDFIVTTANGLDHLYSIEEIAWDGASERLVIGKGVGLARAPLSIDLDGNGKKGRDHVLDLSQADAALSVTPAADGALRLSARADPLHGGNVTVAGATWIVGSPNGDRIFLAPGLRGAEGGVGDDIFLVGDAPVVAPVVVAGGGGADRYVIQHAEARLVIADASALDRIVLDGPPSMVAMAYDAAAPRDLVIRIGFPNDNQRDAEIRVRDFHPGDLGLDPGHGLALLPDDDTGGLELTSGFGAELVESLTGASLGLDAADLCAFAPDSIGGAALPCLLPHG